MMLTPQGVKMSDRAERIYTWLNNQKGISHFTTFSTDECVQRMYSAFQAAYKLLVQEVEARKKHEEWENKTIPAHVDSLVNLKDSQLQNMLADCEAIMRRVPQNRAKGIRNGF